PLPPAPPLPAVPLAPADNEAPPEALGEPPSATVALLPMPFSGSGARTSLSSGRFGSRSDGWSECGKRRSTKAIQWAGRCSALGTGPETVTRNIPQYATAQNRGSPRGLAPTVAGFDLRFAISQASPAFDALMTKRVATTLAPGCQTKPATTTASTNSASAR